MNATTDMHLRVSDHASAAEVTADVVEATGAGLRIVEIAAVTLLGLLVCPPLLILATVVAVPLIAIGLVVGALFAAIAVPTALVRRVRRHHREHGSTMFVHRLLPQQ
jgi:hypothetical protein